MNIWLVLVLRRKIILKNNEVFSAFTEAKFQVFVRFNTLSHYFLCIFFKKNPNFPNHSIIILSFLFSRMLSSPIVYSSPSPREPFAKPVLEYGRVKETIHISG